MSTPPLCGACRSRPRALKGQESGSPVYYDWCAICRNLAGLDHLAVQLKRFHEQRGDQVDEEPVKG